MLIDDLREQLKSTEPIIATIVNYWNNSNLEQRFVHLEQQSKSPNFWQEAELGKELQKIKTQRDQYLSINNLHTQLKELLNLFETDEEELQNLKTDVEKFCRSVKKFKIELLLNGQQDDSNAFLAINAGAGGTESQDWAHILLRMYIRFCEREKLSIEVIDFQPADDAGIKSATLFIRGKKAYGLLKSEQGVHRLVRISPFDANKRRHTSFASVLVTPEIPDIEVVINPNDLRIDTYRASGAGGQHVNKTDSAIRITHLPTNIVVQCQNERSQTQNKETAMKMLRAKLGQRLAQEREEKLAANVVKKKIEWGSQIRSYVLHPYKMVKDHRTEWESPQPDLVLDGELMDFIEQFLIWNATQP